MADEESAQARGDELVPGGHLRATHDDRNRVVEMLRVAAGDGRLILEELDERVGAALTAPTYGELAALVSDLPAASASPAGAAAVRPRDEVRIDCHSASTRRDGPWMVPRRMEVQVTGGSVTLDFTEAVTWWPSLQLDVAVRAGSLKLVIKPGILVSTDDLAVQAASVRVHAPWGAGVPVRSGSMWLARLPAAVSRRARHAGGCGSGCGGVPSPLPFRRPYLRVTAELRAGR